MLNFTKEFVVFDESIKNKVDGIFIKNVVKSVQIMQITQNFGSHLGFLNLYGMVSSSQLIH